MKEGDFQPKTPKEKIEHFRDINLIEREVSRLLPSGEVRLEYEYDNKGNTKSLKVFKKDGTLMYFKDIKGMNDLEFLGIKNS